MLWVQSPLEEVKYLFTFICSFVQRSVLTLGFLCLHCCVRDTVAYIQLYAKTMTYKNFNVKKSCSMLFSFLKNVLQYIYHSYKYLLYLSSSLCVYYFFLFSKVCRDKKVENYWCTESLSIAFRCRVDSFFIKLRTWKSNTEYNGVHNLFWNTPCFSNTSYNIFVGSCYLLYLYCKYIFLCFVEYLVEEAS